MFRSTLRSGLSLPIVLSLIIFTQTAFAGDDWRPVTPEEIGQKTPKVESDADAEAIFWEVRLDDSSESELAFRHYIRVKIFTERGREKFSKIDIPFLKGKKVKDVAARIIRPDGTITELRKEDIFEREIVKVGGIKMKAKSFAVPNIEPGVILEYRYREYFQNDSASGERLVFQRDIPMQKISYYVKPYPGNILSAEYFNMDEVQFVKDKGGFFLVSKENVPSFKEEPRMPPEDQVRSWILLYYTPVNTNSQMVNSLVRWALFSGRISPAFKDSAKPSKEIKALAAELTNGVSSADEKLQKFYEYAQTQIKNISYETTMTDDERKKIKNKNANDVLKRKMGDSADIDIFFASLAQAAGLDSQIVFSGDRNEFFFNPERNGHASFVHPACIAVNVDGKWRYFNPGTPYLPYGELVWNEEDTFGILIGNEKFSWQKTPITNYEKSQARRTGKLSLLEDGTLEGNIKVEYTGHQAISRRRSGYNDSETKRQDDFKEEFKERMSTAEISDLTIENFTDNTKPLVYSFKVRVPNYAQKTGKRLFLQPSFFEYNEKPVFSSATRRYSIHFPYPWSENDDLEITLPKGFALDNADSPGVAADVQRIGSLEVNISVTKDQSTMLYKRKFHFGGGNNVLFPANAYSALKGMFDAFHKADSHTITLKQN
jgi:hypothetical protein